ncbi:unnamed protein product, partial [Mesorhabditis belari]|uniref:Hypoxanthine phosphoribosyltransferase n=1 Tax=Mesorhabditis belari TaxID=2138241 RepID=A0AAF3F9C9_9BILA
MLVEKEKVVLIDFPQMVSMDHTNAKYYFDRDVECVRTLFKRKFNYLCDEYPKFEDMTRKFNLDVQLEASGFTKKMAEDLNKAYDEGNFLMHEEQNKEATSSDESGNGDEEEVEWGSELSEVEEEDEDEADDIDKEEQVAEEQENKKKEQELNKSSRFDSWLKDATSQLDEICEQEGGEEHNLVDHPRIVQAAEEARRDREAYIKAREEADQEELEAIEREIGGDAQEDNAKRQTKKIKTGTKSVRSTSTSIPPDEIKRRVALEAKRNKEKVRLKVKGRQSAVNRYSHFIVEGNGEMASNGHLCKHMAAADAVIPPDFELPVDAFDIPHCYEGDLGAVIVPEGMIKDRVRRLAKDIHAKIGDNELSLLCVLKGSYKFFTALVDELAYARSSCTQPMTVDFIRCQSYEDTQSTGMIQIIGLSNLQELKGKNVLIVEDIVDSGQTLARLLHTLEELGAQKTWTTTLLSKNVPRKVDVKEDFVAFRIPDKFIVGYGLDYNQKFRDLNHICQRSDNPPGIVLRKCNSQRIEIQRSVEVHKPPARVRSITSEGPSFKQTEQTPLDVNQKKADDLPRKKLSGKPKDSQKTSAKEKEKIPLNEVIEPKSKAGPIMKSSCADDSLREFRNTVPDYEAEAEADYGEI